MFDKWYGVESSELCYLWNPVFVCVREKERDREDEEIERESNAW